LINKLLYKRFRKIYEINSKYREPQIKTNKFVKFALLFLRFYLLFLVLILIYRFITLLK